MSEQEANSRRYIAPHVLRLDSGEWAVFDSYRRLQGIFPDLASAAPLLTELSIPPPPKAPPPPRSSLSLEDLGL
jgi:hypothetical protein